MSRPDIRLIATDLDGTIIGNGDEFPVYEQFRDKIDQIRNENDAIWAICTGRNLKSFRIFFDSMRLMGIVPDFVIIKHAYIYGLSSVGYVPHVVWNLQMRFVKWLQRIRVASAIRGWHTMVAGSTRGVTTIVRSSDRLCMRFNSAETAATAANMIRDRVKNYKYVRVFPYVKEVDVRCVPFTKGLSLSELTRHLGMTAENVLAIGDGHNDISMLEPSVARQTGCPANAQPEVVSAVHTFGGHIASKPSLSGVMEILNAYETGNVNSELPSWWRDPVAGDNPRSSSKKLKPKAKKKRKLRQAILFVTAGYVVLMVFASFEMIPAISDAIMKPLEVIVLLIGRMLSFART